MITLQSIELLSPARDADTGIAAIDHGADAVYIGGPAFGARHNAGNSLEEIARLCEYAHRYHARVFMALNTLFTDAELPEARELAFRAAGAGIDALILQDMGLLLGPLPDIELHASTQCDIRTPEKAAFLEAAGFSQVVLARELSLEEIARVRARLSTARIEAFIHGALCVSYSGQCYISEAMTGRSANRGECAQFCRLPYDVETLDGQVLAKSAHVLSLKDNNQSANLEAMMEAGVNTFKIEGRLKDIQYVKNITAYYRGEIDRILARRREWQRSSLGVSTFTFTPDPEKSFNRGSTEYFIHGREYDKPYTLVDIATPKNAGQPVGRVTDFGPGFLTLAPEGGVSLANGDGLTYFDDHGELQGLSVNGVEVLRGGRLRIALRFKTTPAGLSRGSMLLRNRDQAFARLMAGRTAERRIPVDACWESTPEGFVLTLSAAGECASASAPFAHQTPKDAEKNRASLVANLMKTGDTPFSLTECAIDFMGETGFVPASIANDLRRRAAAALEEALVRAQPRTGKAPVDEAAPYPERYLNYSANVANAAARAFYEQHGAKVLQAAFEIVPVKDAALMTCRHCIRATLKLCPKMLKAFPELLEAHDRALFRPDDLLLTDSAGDTFRAVFHCKQTPCEMTLVAA